MRTDLNTLLTALYVWIDDYLGPRRRAGRPPRLTDAELLTLAVAQALLDVRSEARWLRLIPQRLPGAFPYLPAQSGYNKRLRGALPLLKRVIGSWRQTPTCGPIRSGWSTPPRWSAPAPARPRCARSWPGSPATAGAALTPAGSGGCGCT